MEQGLDYREGEELSWCSSWSNSLWQGWSCRLVHCPGGNATDPIWRVLASWTHIYIYIYIGGCVSIYTVICESKIFGGKCSFRMELFKKISTIKFSLFIDYIYLSKSWRQHPTRHQQYGHLPPIMKTIQIRLTRHTGHCLRSRDELISDVLLWTPTYGRAKAGQPARTYIQQLEHTYSSYVRIQDVALKTTSEVMNDRWEWVRDIHASDTWWWYLSLLKKSFNPFCSVIRSITIPKNDFITIKPKKKLSGYPVKEKDNPEFKSNTNTFYQHKSNTNSGQFNMVRPNHHYHHQVALTA